MAMLLYYANLALQGWFTVLKISFIFWYLRDAYQRHEDLLRAKIKPLLTCDFHQPNPLYPQTMGDFDAVTSSFALISGCKDIVEYRTAMKHVTSLLQPRGHFIYATLLNSPFYTVGKEKFSTLSISMDKKQTALKDAGIEIVQLFEHRNKMNTDIVQYEGGVVVLGKKTHLWPRIIFFSGNICWV